MNTLEENYLEIEDSETPLASKSVILVCSVLASPLTAGIIYMSNLYRTKQSGKILGTLILISISELFVQMPFMGFEWAFPNPLINLILKGVTGVFMISWLWSRHFPKESVQKLEMKWLAVTVLLYYTVCYLWSLLIENNVVSSFSVLKYLNFYMSYYGRFEAISIVLLVAFFYRSVKWVSSK